MHSGDGSVCWMMYGTGLRNASHLVKHLAVITYCFQGEGREGKEREGEGREWKGRGWKGSKGTVR